MRSKQVIKIAWKRPDLGGAERDCCTFMTSSNCQILSLLRPTHLDYAVDRVWTPSVRMGGKAINFNRGKSDAELNATKSAFFGKEAPQPNSTGKRFGLCFDFGNPWGYRHLELKESQSASDTAQRYKTLKGPAQDVVQLIIFWYSFRITVRDSEDQGIVSDARHNNSSSSSHFFHGGTSSTWIPAEVPSVAVEQTGK